MKDAFVEIARRASAVYCNAVAARVAFTVLRVPRVSRIGMTMNRELL